MFLTTPTIQLPAFEGPLDLLLLLIEREELDITAISLAQVADQYLAVIEQLGRWCIADLSGFLVIGAKLVWVKSQVLLPRPPSDGTTPEEDVAADLIHQLEEYRRFKRVAQMLAQRDEEGQRAYLRLSLAPLPPPPFDLSGVTLADLLTAAQEALNAKPPAPAAVLPPTLTVAKQIEYIRQRLKQQRRVQFLELLSNAASRVEVIVTLLAVLELLKRDRVRVWQEKLFGPIVIEEREDAPEASNAPTAAPTPLPACQ
jgi:segregation and condensation protein A